MLRAFHISFLIAFCILPAVGQVRVVDVKELSTSSYSSRFYPDAEGRVVISESYLNTLSVDSDADTITIFFGFPQTLSGTNERGGVYGNLDDDPEYELIYPIGAVLYAFNVDGSFVNGWPKTLDYPTDGAAAFGDIDGDGIGEVVVTTHQTATFAFGTVYAFEIDGADAEGFPISTEGGAVRTPVLADLDGDEALEIILAIRQWPEGLIHVYRGDGTVYPGWPVRMDYVPGSAVAVGDINGDATQEIIAESYYSLHAFTHDGFLMQGFPYYPGPDRVFSYSSPVLADLDDDGNREIICGDHSIEDGSGAVHVVNFEGTSLEGWPKITGSWIYGPPAVGDIDGDGLTDIAVGDQALSAVPINKIYAWTGITAEILQGFPILDIFGVNSQIILADLDGDNEIELVFDDNTAEGKYLGYNHDGSLMEGWPLAVDGSTFFINPLVADMNNDGMMDMSGGGYNENIASTNIYLWHVNVEMDDDLAILPVLQYNTRHNGVFGDTFMVGLTEQGSMEAGGQRGMGDWGHGRLKIFPNPGKEIITIEFSILNPEKDHSLRIYDISGRQLKTMQVPDGQHELDVNIENLQQGIYTAFLKEGHAAMASVKFIVTR